MDSDSTSKSTFLGYLRRLSADTANADLSQVISAAVEIPVTCLNIDKSILVGPSAAGNGYFPLAFKSVSQDFLNDCHLLAEDQVVEWAASNRVPRVVENVALESPACGALFQREMIGSLACIPVVAQSETLGLLICMRSSPGGFTPSDMESLGMIADHVALAIRLRRADEPFTQPEMEPLMTRLRESAIAMVDIDELLDSTLQDTLAILRANSGSIMIYEEGGCRVAASQGLRGKITRDSHPAKHTVSMRAIASRKPLLIQGPASRGDYPDAVPRPEIVSSMSVPLQGRVGILGLLNINSTDPGRVFDKQDLHFVASSIARPLAMTVENVRLHEESKAQTRYLRHLYEIARSITSTLQLEQVLRMIINRLRTFVSLDVCALLLYNSHTGDLEVAGGHGIPEEANLDYADLITSAGKLSATRLRPTVIADLNAHPSYLRSELVRKLGLRSAAIIPLTIKRKRVGYLAAFRQQPTGFSQQAVKLFVGLSEMAAIAIENARLYERQMDIAHITQRLLTPSELMPLPGFDIGCRYAPAYQVGGDYYDLIELEGGKFAVVMADVSGKDVTAAAHIAMCKHSLRAIVEHIKSPSAVLKKMNQMIYENTEPETFISMFYSIIDPKSRGLLYSSAGHDPLLLYRAETEQVEYVSTPGIILGITTSATFHEQTTSINSGDVLLMYTDGLIAALATDYDVGLSRLEEALLEWRLKPAQELTDNIHRLAITRSTGRSPDDIALIALKGV